MDNFFEQDLSKIVVHRLFPHATGSCSLMTASGFKISEATIIQANFTFKFDKNTCTCFKYSQSFLTQFSLVLESHHLVVLYGRLLT